ncbi:MAG: MarR family winged helix-turn-helix transcriptional regulator [Candidatus Dormibacteria bacterium]
MRLEAAAADAAVPPKPRITEDADGYLYDCAFREFIARRLNASQLDSAEALRAVALAGKKVTHAFEANLANVGLTHAQYKTLMAVRYGAGAEGGVQMSHVADWLGVTPRNVTSIVDALEAQGLVARITDPRDRRAFMVELTTDGEERAAAALRVNEADQKRVLSGLTAEERKQLRHLCMKLVRSAEEPVPARR